MLRCGLSQAAGIYPRAGRPAVLESAVTYYHRLRATAAVGVGVKLVPGASPTAAGALPATASAATSSSADVVVDVERHPNVARVRCKTRARSPVLGARLVVHV